MLWIKSLHIISVIFWSAGLLYLPRLFVYHAECDDDSGKQRFCIMQSRLYNRIMNPAMAAVLLFGFLLLPYYLRTGGWIAIKLLLVLAMVVFHVYCGFIVKQFNAGKTPHNSKFFRLFNEIPAILIIVIVLLVVIKPF